MFGYVEDYISISLKKLEELGDLERNPYKGKPLDLKGYLESPKETRALNRFLADSGFKPPKLEILSRIKSKEQEYETNPTNELRKEIIDLRLQYNVLR